MSVIEAIILGIIQGLSEFLPVSSSGHIELGKVLLGIEIKENLLVSVVLHFATALSTILVYRKDIWDLIKGLFAFKWNEETQYAAKILLSMIPVGFVGVMMKDLVEQLFDKQVGLVGAMLLVTGTLLLLTQYLQKKSVGKEVGYGQALVIGIAQAIAVLPGISRSGSTIATSLLLGVDKAKAAKFSFLMVLPPILGANLLEIKDYLEEPAIAGGVSGVALGAGFIAAFLVGLAACTWMISLVKKGKLSYFAYYCFVVGTLAVGYWAI